MGEGGGRFDSKEHWRVAPGEEMVLDLNRKSNSFKEANSYGVTFDLYDSKRIGKILIDWLGLERDGEGEFWKDTGPDIPDIRWGDKRM